MVKYHTKPIPNPIRNEIPSNKTEWTNTAIKSSRVKRVIHPRQIAEPSPMVKDAVPLTDRLEAPTNTGWMANSFTNTRVKPLPNALVSNPNHPIPVVSDE